MFILESKDDAVRRGAKVYAKISEYGEQSIHCSSQYSLQHSLRHVDEIVNGLPSKLRNRLNEIDFVSLDANSSVLGDALESRLMRRLFNKHERYPEAGVIKSLVGESYSAGGCFQLLGALYALDQGRGFPTAGFHLEDERCPAPFLTKQREKKNIRKALIWGVGYGRSNHYIICSKV
jgi:3-oxoacyl-[acyl-carrier-protein] synthase II